ncbi:hypothetical protein [Spirillospora sp. NPDC048819]|uniref:hypothetical protein n=1 Tax=Spirillospora sp. NPDC048819 TaxID=3155268 RepID=UPI0033D8CAA5
MRGRGARVAYGQGTWGAAGGAQAPVVIRVESASMAGRHGPNSMTLPVVAQIGDSRMRLRVGDNPVPLPPGVWPVTVWCSYYGMKSGRAELTVDTRAGRPVLLYYTAPRTIYNRGALGYAPAERPGRTTLTLIYTLVPVAVVLTVVVLALLSG